MNAPYLPDMSLKGKLRRRVTRLADRKPLPTFTRRYVSFSFDDFPKSSAEHGAAALESHDLRGTYYACTGQLDTENHFGKLCSAKDIQRLANAGHEIGCHTENHIDCAISHPAIAESDASRNRQVLGELGVHEVNSFAFPYGDVSFASKKILAAFYATLRGVQPGINHRFADANQLLAVPLEGDLPDADYALSFLRALASKPGWLIFYTHDVRKDCSDWGCTPTLLKHVIEAAVQMGATIAPVSDVFKQISQEATS